MIFLAMCQALALAGLFFDHQTVRRVHQGGKMVKMLGLSIPLAK